MKKTPKSSFYSDGVPTDPTDDELLKELEKSLEEINEEYE